MQQYLSTQSVCASGAKSGSSPDQIEASAAQRPFTNSRWTQLFVGVAVVLFWSLPAQAHRVLNGGGWHEGFNHPIHGWDHLLAMPAVGLWAAQQRGRSVWLIPLAFVGVMSLGGLVGMAGISLPGAELMAGLSVLVFGVLVGMKARFRPRWSVVLVGAFAFFHGFAHGQEMPNSVSAVSFGLGFMLATPLRHTLGLVRMRFAAVVLTCPVGDNVIAQEDKTANVLPSARSSGAGTNKAIRLPDVIVTGRSDSLVGIADSATLATVGQKQLEDRPMSRSGEILETVPGVIITQHAGGGKANQYYPRGFNLDHGTDCATDLDGMPLNLPAHDHGQGYSDMNIVIPELLLRVDHERGPAWPQDGDFSSAGAAHLNRYQTPPRSIAILESGMHGFARVVLAASPKVGAGDMLYGVEAYHEDGLWQNPDDYHKFNGILTYSQGDTARGFSVTVRGYHRKWNSSDQIAASCGRTNFFDTFNPTTGGNSQRYSLQAQWHRADENSATQVTAYGFYCDLDLFSDFTYFLTDTNKGDQFEQTETRWVAGLIASHTLFSQWWGHEVQNTFGLQVRNDWTKNGLYQTQNRYRTEKIDSATSAILPASTHQDSVVQTEIGMHYINQAQWAEKFRSVFGVRGDIYNFSVSDQIPANSGDRVSGLASPRLSLIFGPWAQTEVYLQGGLAFHSNDGRSTTATTNTDGMVIGKKAAGLARTEGAQIGARTLVVPKLQSTLPFWYLHSDSELLFQGDTGDTFAAPQPSNRYGVELANYYTPADWLAFDFDYVDSIARFESPDSDGGTRAPQAVGQVLWAGATIHDPNGFTGGLRLRYFGPRDLISTGQYQSGETLLLTAPASYRFSKTWTLLVEVLNLLNRHDHDIDYAYESRADPAGAASTQIHFHPVEPIQLRIGLTARF